MTAIVAINYNDTIWMAGDSAGVAGYHITARKDPKVFVSGKMLIGFTSSFRMGNLLRFNLDKELKAQPRGQDDFEYMCTTVVDAMRKVFKDGGYSHVSNNVETGGTFLVGYKKNLYTFHSDYQVGMSYNTYDAVGCGRDLCLGAMSVLAKSKLAPEKMLTMALDAATLHSAGVCAPYTILHT